MSSYFVFKDINNDPVFVERNHILSFYKEYNTVIILLKDNPTKIYVANPISEVINMFNKKDSGSAFVYKTEEGEISASNWAHNTVNNTGKVWK